MTTTSVPTPKPTIGRIVHYRWPTGSGPDIAHEVAGDFHLAAIVIMTPQEWSPGYRTNDGTWEPTDAKYPSPKDGTVHLAAFMPDGTSQLVKDAPYGTGPGTWSWPPQA